MNGPQGGGMGQQFGQRSMPAFGGYGGGSYGGGGMNQGYGGGGYGGSGMFGQRQPMQQPYGQRMQQPGGMNSMGGSNGNMAWGGNGFMRPNFGSPGRSEVDPGFNVDGPRTGGENISDPYSVMAKPMAYSPQTGGNDTFNSPSPQQFSSIPPWANQNQPGSPYNTAGMAKPMQMPNGQPMTGGNDTFPDSGMHPVQQPQYQPYGQPQTGGGDYQNAQKPMAGDTAGIMSQPYQSASQPQSWEQQNAQLLRPQDPMQNPAYASSPAGPPPGPGNPNTPPPSQMQNGQVGWAWNAGTSGINPQGWNAQFTPGYQQYISSMTGGMNPQQRSLLDYNNLVGSIGQVSGQQYNPNIYGAR